MANMQNTTQSACWCMQLSDRGNKTSGSLKLQNLDKTSFYSCPKSMTLPLARANKKFKSVFFFFLLLHAAVCYHCKLSSPLLRFAPLDIATSPNETVN